MENKITFEFSKKDSKRANILGLRAAYGLSTLNCKEAYPDLAVFTADTSTSAGLDRFKNSYPDSFYDCGIAEQCLISSAAGYVASGGTALASTFAPFLILRAAEQVRLSLGYMNIPLLITGLASGLTLGHLGYTHCCVEDLSFILSIPNILIYSPSDSYELKCILPKLIELKRPTYIRLTGSAKVKAVHKESFTTDFFSPIHILGSGNKLLLLSIGTISGNAIQALESLGSSYLDQISLFVVPFLNGEKTRSAISKLICNFNNILVLDESTYGGLAALVGREILKINHKINYAYNIHPEYYLISGQHDYMLSQCKLDTKGIKDSIINLLE